MPPPTLNSEEPSNEGGRPWFPTGGPNDQWC